MAERIPAEAFPPGEFIRDEMEARGWKQADLANVMGRSLKFVNELLTGKTGLTPETARGLAAAFDTSAQVWLNLECSYRLWLQAQKDKEEGKDSEEVALRGKLYSFAPVRDMIKRGWIEGATTTHGLEACLNRFYGGSIVDGGHTLSLAIAARKSTSYSTTTPTQLAWAYRARRLAETVPVAKFDKNVFANGLVDLHKLVAGEAEVRHIPRLLAELGVRLVVVQHLTGSRIDGAAFWLDKERKSKPVIAISMRYDRIDNFWFTLAHECAHIVYGHEGSLDNDLVGAEAIPTDTKPEEEKKADMWAANYLIPSDEIEKFILRVNPYFSKVRINQFANRLRTHPGIIVGQLQRRKIGVEYWHNREMLVKVRSILTRSAMTDGWGAKPDLR